MNRQLCDVLVDPMDGGTLTIETSDEGSIVETGRLLGRRRSYPIVKGIPRLVLTEDAGQSQTQESFGFKWQQVSSYDSPKMRGAAARWLIDRYGFTSPQAMEQYLSAKGRVLDAGCGSAFSSSLWLSPAWAGEMWVGADISEAIDVAQQRLAHLPHVHFVQADVLQLPFAPGSFDAIFSEGVLHHTPSTERAFKALVPLLRPGGELMVYIYRKKSPAREFTDDSVRAQIAGLPPAEAWEMMRPLTRLGQALAELHVEVEVPEDVTLLGIPKGRYDVQRLIYWHFAKLFWNDQYSFDENLHVNFDWYHPRYAHRHDEAELRTWCADSSLEVIHFDAQESGFTVRAVRA